MTIKVTTQNDGWTEPKKKPRKPRKPMSEEQRQAAAKRLEKARAVRIAKNPDYGKSGLHHSIRDLHDDHPLNPKTVKLWIKTQKGLLAAARQGIRTGVKGAIAKHMEHAGYIRVMERYLKDGAWIGLYYGEYQQIRMTYTCVTMAYDEKGNPKIDVPHTHYPELYRDSHDEQ
jgi:hypothetical protein